MTIAAIAGAAAPKSTGTTETKSKTAVDYESFLKLLVAEMKNQDPTKPMESTDFVAQLATFSQVEQSVQSNAKLDQILQSTALSQAGSLIGRQITSADGETSGIISEVKIKSDGVVAVLKNGKEVRGRRRRGHQGGGLTAMNEADALDIVQFAIWTVLTAAGPAVAVAMVVGVAIALVQALTQVQEITLTFVPKIVAILLVVAFTGPFIGSQISSFSNVVFERIQNGF